MTIEKMFDLSGQTAVIIGGARDLGYDMSDILAAAGCDIALTSRDVTKAEAAADKLRTAHGREILAAALDICDHAQVSDDVLQGLPRGQMTTHRVISTQGRATGGHQISHTGQPLKGQPVGSKGISQTAHLTQAAGDER